MLNEFTRTNRDKILNAMQDIELEGLVEIDRICRKHNICYSLGGGTCLGQVRHGGFIPWDDDIDIDMTVENYNKFLQVVHDELDENRFFLRCRQTDRHWLRSYMRLENRNTHLEMTRYNALEEQPDIGIFVDIARLNHLPDDPVKRKKVADKLYFLRAVENYKEIKVLTSGIPLSWQLPVILYSKLFSDEAVVRKEEKIVERCEKEQSGWINADMLVTGNFGGYPVDGADKYKDVVFENITVMDKSNTHNFLERTYGPDYGKWLEPIRRISHHFWTDLDLGPYAEKYGLPEDYSKYVSVNINEDRLIRMQQLSIEMLDKVREICKEKGIKCYQAVKRPNASGFNKDCRLWSGPLKLMMPYEDYQKFACICQKELGEKYFFQNNETDREFRFTHSRIRLKYTRLREKRISPRLEERYNRGLYLDIIPVVRTSTDKKASRKHMNGIRKINRLMRLKWRMKIPKTFLDSSLKNKIRWVTLIPVSFENLKEKLRKSYVKYDCDPPVYVDGTGLELDGYMPEDKFEKECGTFAGQKMIETYPETIEELMKTVSKKYGYCHLNFYDSPEYQLSVLRYDEKSGNMLTNKEIMGFE